MKDTALKDKDKKIFVHKYLSVSRIHVGIYIYELIYIYKQ